MSKHRVIFLAVLSVCVITIILRLFAIHAYDLQIDEITYAHFAKTIDARQLPRDYSGNPFFLHPPGYFVLLAIWRGAFWHGGSIFAQYTLLRGLNILLSGLSVLCLFGLTKAVTKSSKFGLLASALFAVDPFLIRQNTRGLMETATMLWLLAALWLLFKNLEQHAANNRAWFGVGLAFGLGIVTKDVAVVFFVLVFALLAIRKVGPSREALRSILPGALIPYSIWLLVVAADGYARAFIHQKTVGIQRFFGLLQTTGYNSAASPSKGSTLIQTIPHYTSSYLIMGLGAAASFWLLFSNDPTRRRWGYCQYNGIATTGLPLYRRHL